MRKIIVQAKPDGSVKIETVGYIGEACQSASDSYSRAVGKITSDTPTSERYVTQQTDSATLTNG
jgi:hypothetical protein